MYAFEYKCTWLFVLSLNIDRQALKHVAKIERGNLFNVFLLAITFYCLENYSPVAYIG